jgi:hypothetical protein
MVSAKGVLRHEGFPYALDNGAWTAFQRGEPFDEAAFVRAVELMGNGADWIVLPDIVCGGMASLDFSMAWADRIRGIAPMMIAVQNGMEAEHIRSLIGPSVGVFVGGDSDWKETTLPLWGELCRERGALLHVGRVNSVRRIALCAAAGADSFDGSACSRFSVHAGRLAAAAAQPDMWAEHKCL